MSVERVPKNNINCDDKLTQKDLSMHMLHKELDLVL